MFADSVATDGDGKASVSYTLPDNLTSYRVWAFAATQACFGFIEEAVTAQLPLMVCVTACGRLRDFERLCGLLLCLFDLFGCTLSISFTSNLAFASPSDPHHCLSRFARRRRGSSTLATSARSTWCFRTRPKAT